MVRWNFVNREFEAGLCECCREVFCNDEHDGAGSIIIKVIVWSSERLVWQAVVVQFIRNFYGAEAWSLIFGCVLQLRIAPVLLVTSFWLLNIQIIS